MKFLKIKIIILALLIIFIFSLPLSAFNLEKRVKEYTLNNGLKLLLVERHIAPTLSFYMRFKVGSVDEVSGKTGIAHLLEHMLFKGTKILGTKDYQKEKPLLEKIDRLALLLDQERKKSGGGDKHKLEEIEKQLKKIQAEHKKWVISDEFSRIYAENGGVGYNAYTGPDATTYLISLPANKLELWAAIESDRLANPILREYYAERDVVKEERRMRVETQPDGLLYEQFLAAAFLVHPYRNPVIGWMSELKFLSKKDTEDFLRKYYVPNNTVVAIVGDLNPSQVIKTVEDYFGSIPAQVFPPPPATVEPEQAGERRIELLWEAQPQVLIGYHKGSLTHPDEAVFDILDGVLSSGRTSRLHKKMIQKEKIAVSVYTFTTPGDRYPNLFCFSLIPRFPHTVAELETTLYSELERLKKEKIGERELNKIKNQYLAGFIRSLNSNSGLARQLVTAESTAGSWKFILEHLERIKAVTAQDIMRVANKYFTKKNRTVAVLVKKDEK